MSKFDDLNKLIKRLENFKIDTEFELLLKDIKSFVMQYYTENSHEYFDLLDKENIYRMIPYDADGIFIRKQTFGTMLNSYKV